MEEVMERGPDIVLVLAIALSSVWLMLNLCTASTAMGQARDITIGLGWWWPSVALWLLWVGIR